MKTKYQICIIKHVRIGNGYVQVFSPIQTFDQEIDAKRYIDKALHTKTGGVMTYTILPIYSNK